MTQKLLIAGTVLSLLLSGCGQNAPELDGKNNISDASDIGGDTVAVLWEIITAVVMDLEVFILDLEIIR